MNRPIDSIAVPSVLRHALFMSAVLMIVVPSSAYAQNPPAGSGKSSKRTTVSFEDQLVEGQAQKPELFYLLQQRNNSFKRLIRLRENFLPEMRKTSEDVGRPSAAKGSAP